MDVRKKRDLPCIQNRSEARFLGSESKNQNSEKNIFQVFLHSPCTCKNFSIKTFPRQRKLFILHYITLSCEHYSYQLAKGLYADCNKLTMYTVQIPKSACGTTMFTTAVTNETTYYTECQFSMTRQLPNKVKRFPTQ